MNIFKPAMLAAALLAGACATTPGGNGYTHIYDTSELFSAADWSPPLEAAVNAAGWSDRAEQIKTHLNEKTGWPANMANEDTRWLQQATIAKYNVKEVARFNYYDKAAVLLHVPAAANQHMTEGWKPTEDFFIVVTEAAMDAPSP